MARSTTDSVAHDLQLTADEAIVLTALQQVMIARDLIVEKSQRRVEVKTRYRNDVAASATATLWSRPADLPDWAVEPAAAIAAKVPAHQRPFLETAAAEFGLRSASDPALSCSPLNSLPINPGVRRRRG
jgi:hypothetical protein